MKRKPKQKLEKGNEARRLARKLALPPGSTRVVENKKRKEAKHKKDLILEMDA
jgi:hypothetical protein